MMNPLKTPATFGGKKSLLKKMVRNTAPSKLNLKKASLKTVLGKKMGSMKTGSPFKLNSGLGVAPMKDGDGMTSGRGTNLGTSGVF